MLKRSSQKNRGEAKRCSIHLSVPMQVRKSSEFLKTSYNTGTDVYSSFYAPASKSTTDEECSSQILGTVDGLCKYTEICDRRGLNYANNSSTVPLIILLLGSPIFSTLSF